jgi:hypothetical protein
LSDKTAQRIQRYLKQLACSGELAAEADACYDARKRNGTSERTVGDVGHVQNGRSVFTKYRASGLGFS